MRQYLLLLLVLFLPLTPVYGQARTDARKSAGGDVTVPRYRAISIDGDVYYIVSYKKAYSFYVFTDVKDRHSTDPIAFIAKIEPLSDKEAEASVDGSGNSGFESSSSARVGPRVEARTEARTSYSTGSFPKPKKRQYAASASEYSPSPFGGTAGFTPTGLPLYVGPRGGIYHITSGGNKAYQSR